MSLSDSDSSSDDDFVIEVLRVLPRPSFFVIDPIHLQNMMI